MPTSLSAACRTIVYSLVEVRLGMHQVPRAIASRGSAERLLSPASQVASLQGELNAANRTSEEINRMAQNQLVEAAQAMRKMKQHVEQLARTKRDYESKINDMSEKLTAAEKTHLEVRNQKIIEGTDQTVLNELEEARTEVTFLRCVWLPACQALSHPRRIYLPAYVCPAGCPPCCLPSRLECVSHVVRAADVCSAHLARATTGRSCRTPSSTASAC
eukprot:COSAG01_NODE_14004_length_1509_cov_0.983688_2_plen_217_part_00